MITLYGIPGTATSAPHMILEEIGTLYDFVLVERDEEGVPTAPPGYLELSPFGKVPALRHNELELTESAAICLHLADAFPDHDLMPKVGTEERSVAMRWLMFLTNTVQPAYLRYFYSARHTIDAQGADDVQAAAMVELTALRDEVARTLGAGPFVLGERFTIVDCYLAMLASWSSDMPADASWWSAPSIAAHYNAVLARPGCRKAIEDEGGSLSAP